MMGLEIVTGSHNGKICEFCHKVKAGYSHWNCNIPVPSSSRDELNHYGNYRHTDPAGILGEPCGCGTAPQSVTQGSGGSGLEWSGGNQGAVSVRRYPPGKPCGLQQKDLTKYIPAKSKVSEVMNRKRPLSLPMIRSLHKHLGIPAVVLVEEPKGVYLQKSRSGEAGKTKKPRIPSEAKS